MGKDSICTSGWLAFALAGGENLTRRTGTPRLHNQKSFIYPAQCNYHLDWLFDGETKTEVHSVFYVHPFLALSKILQTRPSGSPHPTIQTIRHSAADRTDPAVDRGYLPSGRVILFFLVILHHGFDITVSAGMAGHLTTIQNQDPVGNLI